MARVNYETAAKLEIYRQNKDGAEKFLRLAKEITENDDAHKPVIETMITNMDEVLNFKVVFQLSYSSEG